MNLIQSVVASTVYFMDKSEPENVYKYFIYLTNNGRFVVTIFLCPKNLNLKIDEKQIKIRAGKIFVMI